MHQHGRQQAPPLTGVDHLRQGGEVDVVAVDSEVDEVQPADDGKVLAELGQRRGHQRQHQHCSGQRAGSQCPEKAALGSLLRLGRGFVALGIALVKIAHLLD